MGVSFISSVPPVIDQRRSIRFQTHLLDSGIEIKNAQILENEIRIINPAPVPLQVTAKALSPQPLGQLTVTAPHPARRLIDFIEECEAVSEAYEHTWPAPQRQVVACDAILRDLYETDSEHAFKELWETWLQQASGALAPLGRPVLGGGLRFVMPAILPDHPTNTEVKIESYLRNTSQFFVETRFAWLEQVRGTKVFDPRARLTEVYEYVRDHVEALVKERMR